MSSKNKVAGDGFGATFCLTVVMNLDFAPNLNLFWKFLDPNRIPKRIRHFEKMAFSDLFQNLEDICKSDITQGANETTSTHEETLFGDVTEPYLTHFKHGEALENIKSEAKVRLGNALEWIRLELFICFGRF